VANYATGDGEVRAVETSLQREERERVSCLLIEKDEYSCASSLARASTFIRESIAHAACIIPATSNAFEKEEFFRHVHINEPLTPLVL